MFYLLKQISSQGDEIRMYSKGNTNDNIGTGQKRKSLVNKLNINKY